MTITELNKWCQEIDDAIALNEAAMRDIPGRRQQRDEQSANMEGC